MRFHLFEFEDYPWCPSGAREFITDYLRFHYRTFRFSKLLAKHLLAFMKTCSSQVLVEACAGSAPLTAEIHEEASVQHVHLEHVLTDLYPNLKAFQQAKEIAPSSITPIETGIDATKMPKEIRGTRFFLSSFHHFKPESAKELLEDAFSAKDPVAIYESTDSTPLFLFVLLIHAPLSLPFMFIKTGPTVERFLFMFLIPIYSVMLIWDGIASCLRTYSKSDFRKLLLALPDSANYSVHQGFLYRQYGILGPSVDSPTRPFHPMYIRYYTLAPITES